MVEAGAVSVFVSIRHITTHLDVLSSAGHERSFGVEAVQTESELELLVQQNEDPNTLGLKI